VNGQADVMVLDGGDILKYRDDVTVVAAEDHGLGEANYYAVAAVKKDDTHLNISNVVEYNSCHTGVGKTAGWNMPIAWFLNNLGDNSIKFRESCAPGAESSSYQSIAKSVSNTTNWCSLCIGKNDQGADKCERNNNERFYGYDGAFNCLKKGKGDVAFIKHSTIPAAEYSSFELLCTDGSRKSPSEWNKCHIGMVPSHALVTNSSTVASTIADINSKLTAAWRNLGSKRFDGGKNLLWGSSVEKFITYNGGKSGNDYIKGDYLCAMHKMTTGITLPNCNTVNDSRNDKST